MMGFFFGFRVFSRQQYFDSKGLFISIVFSVPILLNCMIMVVSYNFCFYFISRFRSISHKKLFIPNLKFTKFLTKLKKIVHMRSIEPEVPPILKPLQKKLIKFKLKKNSLSVNLSRKTNYTEIKTYKISHKTKKKLSLPNKYFRLQSNRKMTN